MQEQGLSGATLSFELRHEQLRDISKCIPCEAIVYGRLPLMITENCIVANEFGCRRFKGRCGAVCADSACAGAPELTAVIGGGVGNLIDRVRLGYVVDMLDCTFIEFPVFNVADCFVVCGTIAALVYYIWIYPNTDAKNWEKDHGTDPAQGK